MAAIVIQLTYGKELWMEKGQELVDLNVESVRLIVSVFMKVWLVDYIHWCAYSGFSCRETTLTYCIQCVSYQAGCLVHSSGGLELALPGYRIV
jgi:hypothetical protein